jgi:NADH-quinone oxidoreductase subunit J
MATTFYISAAVAIIATAMAITRSNGVHALLYLIVSFLAVALLFFVMGAPFIAALEVIIYAGAIMVLFIFAAMMFNLGQESVPQEREWLKPGMWIIPSILAAILLAQLIELILVGGDRALASGVTAPQ